MVGGLQGCIECVCVRGYELSGLKRLGCLSEMARSLGSGRDEDSAHHMCSPMLVLGSDHDEDSAHHMCAPMLVLWSDHDEDSAHHTCSPMLVLGSDYDKDSAHHMCNPMLVLAGLTSAGMTHRQL